MKRTFFILAFFIMLQNSADLFSAAPLALRLKNLAVKVALYTKRTFLLTGFGFGGYGTYSLCKEASELQAHTMPTTIPAIPQTPEIPLMPEGTPTISLPTNPAPEIIPPSNFNNQPEVNPSSGIAVTVLKTIKESSIKCASALLPESYFNFLNNNPLITKLLLGYVVAGQVYVHVVKRIMHSRGMESNRWITRSRAADVDAGIFDDIFFPHLMWSDIWSSDCLKRIPFIRHSEFLRNIFNNEKFLWII